MVISYSKICNLTLAVGVRSERPFFVLSAFSPPLSLSLSFLSFSVSISVIAPSLPPWLYDSFTNLIFLCFSPSPFQIIRYISTAASQLSYSSAPPLIIMTGEMSGEQLQARITAARREAETLKDRIRRKKEELSDTSCRFLLLRL